jgi:hypothetical protein
VLVEDELVVVSVIFGVGFVAQLSPEVVHDLNETFVELADCEYAEHKFVVNSVFRRIRVFVVGSEYFC